MSTPAGATPLRASSEPSFQWEDPLNLQSSLSEDEIIVMESARDYCQAKLQPRVLEANRNEVFDREWSASAVPAVDFTVVGVDHPGDVLSKGVLG